MEPLPEFIQPMLSTLGEYPPEGEEWLHELRYEGYRLLCRIDGDDVRLFTRNFHDWTGKFPEIVESLREAAALRAWLDGQLVFTTTDGRPCFGPLRSAVRGRRQHCLSYLVFDMMHRDGEDLREIPLLVRKQLLGEVLPSAPNLRVVDHILGRGRDVFRSACRMNIPGLMSKRALSPYLSGRSTEWVKVRCPQHAPIGDSGRGERD